MKEYLYLEWWWLFCRYHLAGTSWYDILPRTQEKWVQRLIGKNQSPFIKNFKNLILKIYLIINLERLFSEEYNDF